MTFTGFERHPQPHPALSALPWLKLNSSECVWELVTGRFLAMRDTTPKGLGPARISLGRKLRAQPLCEVASLDWRLRCV